MVQRINDLIPLQILLQSAYIVIVYLLLNSKVMGDAYGSCSYIATTTTIKYYINVYTKQTTMIHFQQIKNKYSVKSVQSRPVNFCSINKTWCCCFVFLFLKWRRWCRCGAFSVRVNRFEANGGNLDMNGFDLFGCGEWRSFGKLQLEIKLEIYILGIFYCAKLLELNVFLLQSRYQLSTFQSWAWGLCLASNIRFKLLDFYSTGIKFEVFWFRKQL